MDLGTMDDPAFRGDCARCSGLCCMALAFDRGESFAADKAAGEPCEHLGAGFKCAIHADRDTRGYRGCVGYDCLGAGQLTTALFAQAWTASHSERRVQMQVFMRLRQLQVLRLYAERSHQPIPPQYEPSPNWTWETVLLLDLGRLRETVVGRATLAGRQRSAASE